MPYENLKNNEHGATLIELLVGLAIGMILLGIVIKIFIIQQESFHFQTQVSEMNQNVRSAMDMMVRDIRMTGYDPTGAGLVGLGLSSDTSIRIYADIDGSGGTNSADEDITYYYDPDDRQIERNGPDKPIAENIEIFNLSYLDKDGVVTAVATETRQILITIVGRTKHEHRVTGYKYGTLTTHVTPKNLGF